MEHLSCCTLLSTGVEHRRVYVKVVLICDFVKEKSDCQPNSETLVQSVWVDSLKHTVGDLYQTIFHFLQMFVVWTYKRTHMHTAYRTFY